MKKIIIFFFTSFLLCQLVSAQLLLRGGVNYSNIDIDGSTRQEVFDRKPGFHLGLNANLPIGAVMSLRPAAMYHLKGGENSSGNVDLNYLEVPLNLGFTLGPLVVEGGPYFGYLISGGNNVFSKDTFSKSDWGANFGAVINLGNLGIGANYSNSLANLNGDQTVWGEATKIKNGNLSLFVLFKL